MEADGSSRRRLLVLSALAGALALVHLALPILSLPRLEPLNYNEGWNAYHAEAVLSDAPLYPPASALFPNNYPPLSFGVVALLSLAARDAILPGRLLSLASFLVMVLELVVLGRRVGGSLSHGLFAGALFAALLAAPFGEYVGIDDPQLLGHVFVLGGLVLITGGRTPARVGGAAVLMVLGGLVKHNLLAVPLAITAWLFVRDRRAFGAWAAAAVASAGAALLGLGLVHGRSVFDSLLAPRITELALGATKWAQWLPSLAAPLALGLVAAPAAWRDRELRWLALYAALALGLGLFFSMGAGVSYNVFFDLVIALSLLGVLLLARAAPTLSSWALGLALLVGPALGAPLVFTSFGLRLAEVRRVEAATWQDVQYLTGRPGPAVCETLALCFWAGKPPTVDLFNSRQAFATDRADEQLLLERFARGEFAVVQLTSISRDRDDERISNAIVQALQKRYVVDRISANGVFLRPR